MNICIFASGAGTNFKAILDSIKSGYLKSKISLLISNNPESGAVEIAKKNKINYLIISKGLFPQLSKEEYSRKFLTALQDNKIDFIVLAGYMKKIDPVILKNYENRIINIHPALLPSFGGKGMFGMNVHRAVIESGSQVSGITVHFVNENYDEGKIIFQKSCKVKPDDDEVSLQKKIQELEHEYYPMVIRNFELGIR